VDGPEKGVIPPTMAKKGGHEAVKGEKAAAGGKCPSGKFVIWTDHRVVYKHRLRKRGQTEKDRSGAGERRTRRLPGGGLRPPHMLGW